MDADWNLRFGLRAVEAGKINTTQLGEAISLWLEGGAGSLGDVLTERGWISAESRTEIETRIDESIADDSAQMPRTPRGTPGEMSTLGHQPGASGGPPTQPMGPALDGPPTEPQLAETELQHWGARAHVPPVNGTPASRDRYTIDRFLAKGGIGQVWLARDGHLERDVALKELRPDRANDAHTVARFIEEARITGQLEHPGIVPVHELAWGNADQRPFYTMRFVRGRTLSKAAQAYHRDLAKGRAGLFELRAMLTAFVAACQAVAYAHSRGVLHRDLKGENVVLGDFGEVMVLDWGLARLVDRPDTESALPPVTIEPVDGREETTAGRALGTPAYMSPEQAKGDVDQINQRTDVYGLGAMLYEILTGRPPFTKEPSKETIRRVIDEEPPKPRSLCPSVPPALEALCFKAIAKKQADRYASAIDLARDVERWLADEPIDVYREPWPQRASRWARRHKPIIAASAALLMTTLVGLSIGIGLINEEKNRVLDAQARDKLHFTQARKVVDHLLASYGDIRLARVPHFEEERRRLADEAIANYRYFLEGDPNDYEIRRSLADALKVSALIYRLGNKFDQAIGAYNEALQLFEKADSAHKGRPDDMQPVAAINHDLAELYWTVGRPREGTQFNVKALELVLALQKRFPGETPFRRKEARLRLQQAKLLRSTGRFSESLTNAGDSIALWKELAAGTDHQSTDEIELTMAEIERGIAQRELGQSTDAERTFVDAIELARKGVDAQPGDIDREAFLADGLHELSLLLAADPKRLQEAAAPLAEANTIAGGLAADFPWYKMYRSFWAETLHSQGRLRVAIGQAPEAERSFQQAREEFEKLLHESPRMPSYHGLLGRTLADQARLARTQGKRPEGRILSSEALEHLDEALRANPEEPFFLRARDRARTDASD
jgi:eukaryotic-like serine/threonine-protein kinase